MVGRNEFKEGDRVECISPGAHHDLRKGEIYIIVTQRPSGLVKIRGSSYEFSAMRFKLSHPYKSLSELWRSVQDDG